MNKRQIKDLKIDYLSPISGKISLERAWDYMIKNEVKALPVIDEKQSYIGMVTMEEITKAYTRGIEDTDIYELEIPLENIIHTLRATLTGEKKQNVKIKDVKIQSLKETKQINIGSQDTTIITPYHKKTVDRILIRCIPVQYILGPKAHTSFNMNENVKKAEEKARKTDARYFAVLRQEDIPVGVIEREEILYQFQSKRKVKNAI